MNARPFDWADLELFLAIARGGSLATAAGTLQVDSSTVQRRIGKLEATLGTRLFARSQRGYALTHAGEELLPYARAIDEQAVAAGRRLLAQDQKLGGMIRVSAADDFAHSMVIPVIAAFHRKHPGVAVTLDTASSFANLARQQAEVALRITPQAPEGDVIAKHVAEIGVALYGSRAYFGKHGLPKRLQELMQHWVVRGDVTTPSFPGERFSDLHFSPDRVAFRCQTFSARHAAIRDGMGIGMLACFAGDRDEQLVRLPFKPVETPINLWLLVHVDLRQNARVRAFVDHAYGALVAQRTRLEGDGRAQRPFRPATLRTQMKKE